MENTEQRIKKIVSDFLEPGTAEIKVTDSLSRTFGADSLDKIEFVLAIEDEFSIRIPDDKIKELDTIQSFINFIEALPTIDETKKREEFERRHESFVREDKQWIMYGYDAGLRDGKSIKQAARKQMATKPE